MHKMMEINKIYLKPRAGWQGWLDRLIGPGATRAELLLQFIPAIFAAILAPIYAGTLPVQWHLGQLGIMAFLALDLVGGVITNATSSAKRWYHRPGQGWVEHFRFASVHLLHILIVALVFRGGDWVFFLSVSSYLLGATMVILRSPLYLQRPIAMGLYGLVLLSDRYLFSPTPGLEWFLSFFFLKILIAHLLPEIPYTPGRLDGKPALEQSKLDGWG